MENTERTVAILDEDGEIEVMFPTVRDFMMFVRSSETAEEEQEPTQEMLR